MAFREGAAWRGGLWSSADFVKFWAGQSVSMVGSQFTLLALPLTAVLTLHASAAEMGLLGAALAAPALVLGPAAGVWLDRARRRPVLVWASAASAVALATVPAAALVHALTMAQLYAVALVSGAAATIFTVAQNAFVPTLAGRANLVEAQSKLQTSRTLASLVGPGLAGAVVQALTAPVAIALDAASFVAGALTASWIRTPEPEPQHRPARHVLAEAWEGLAILWAQPLVRAIVLSLVTGNLFPFLSNAVYVLLFVGRLGVTPFQIGLAAATASLSSLLGAQVARPLIHRAGLGPVMVVGAGLFSIGPLLLLTAAFAPHRLVVPLLVASGLVTGFGLMVYNINQIAIRQALIPDRLLGRASGGTQLVTLAAQVAGSLVGGLVGQHVGLEAALALGTVGTGTCVLTVLLSPVRSLREVPRLGA